MTKKEILKLLEKYMKALDKGHITAREANALCRLVENWIIVKTGQGV